MKDTANSEVKLWDKLKEECKNAEFSENQIIYAREIVREYNQDYIDQSKSHKGTEVDFSLENLNLKQAIETEKLKELLDSSTDFMPRIARHELTYEQAQMLGESEKQQYRDQRKSLISSQKAALNSADDNLDELMSMVGVESKEEKDKKRTKIPPKQLWGVSDTYEYLLTLAEAHDSISKYLYDVAKQTYVFKLDRKLDRELQPYLEEYHDKMAMPGLKYAILQANQQKYILDNVQDEKNRDTLQGWIQKSVHKFLESGNHGTGELDFINTGVYIMKLDNDSKTVLRIPIKREFTREQIDDKTEFELNDETNQMFITCPECKLEFNKPIITDEKRDVIAGDYFNKSLNILLTNPLSRVIEGICDNVIIQQIKTPEQFLKEEYARKGIGIKGLNFKDFKVVNVEKSVKIKEEDLDPELQTDIGYNIMYGRANRTWKKAAHFSAQA